MQPGKWRGGHTKGRAALTINLSRSQDPGVDNRMDSALVEREARRTALSGRRVDRGRGQLARHSPAG